MTVSFLSDDIVVGMQMGGSGQEGGSCCDELEWDVENEMLDAVDAKVGSGGGLVGVVDENGGEKEWIDG